MSCGQNTSIDTDYRTELRFSVFFDWIEENIFWVERKRYKIGNFVGSANLSYYDRSWYSIITIERRERELVEWIMLWGAPRLDWFTVRSTE